MWHLPPQASVISTFSLARTKPGSDKRPLQLRAYGPRCRVTRPVPASSLVEVPGAGSTTLPVTPWVVSMVSKSKHCSIWRTQTQYHTPVVARERPRPASTTFLAPGQAAPPWAAPVRLQGSSSSSNKCKHRHRCSSICKAHRWLQCRQQCRRMSSARWPCLRPAWPTHLKR
jgi:hypothetical protein